MNGHLGRPCRPTSRVIGPAAFRFFLVALTLALGSVLAVACGESDVALAPPQASFSYAVPLDPGSPWPKFRRNTLQNGRSDVSPSAAGGRLWTFPTDRGVFSSPVIGPDGTVYVGSADRTFYALNANSTVRWQMLTGDIIDSAALLDDRGRVYFGSGDGRLYALKAATGERVWTFQADDPIVNKAYINWFEGNVAMGSDGTLYVPNDNFFTYAIDRDTAGVLWRFKTVDQTWSLPAVNVDSGTLFMGNNNLVSLLGFNTFAIDAATGKSKWRTAVNGTVAASPMLTTDGKMVVGSFDGYVRCYDQQGLKLLWSFGTRDHIYASPAQLPDGTIIQPSADGTVYALDPATGALVWAFDTREPIRSSPAVDADGNVYVGSGEGRLLVLNPDGTLRWSILLIDAERNDLNASPALGRDAIVIAGESGEVFSVPYDYCLQDAAHGDSRCRLGPGEDLPNDGAYLLFTTQFGRTLDEPPADIGPNQPLTFSLFVRKNGDTQLALIDSQSLSVTIDPATAVRTEVSGDRKFVTIVPTSHFTASDTGELSVAIDGNYLVNPTRNGLHFTGGDVGGTLSGRYRFRLQGSRAGGLPLPVPSAPGEAAGVWELYRLAAPLPTILPSYNQIGFDSIHYLMGLVTNTGDGGAIAWVVGAKLAEGENRTVIDPATRVLFPLEVAYDGGFLTLTNESGFAIEFNHLRLPFDFFRIATRIDENGAALESPRINVLAVCSGITFYGQFLRVLGFCNPQTDVLNVFGGAELRPYEGGTVMAPTGVGTVSFAAHSDAITATLAGSSLQADEHSLGILLVDPSTNQPVSLDYGYATQRTTNSAGQLEVSLALDRSKVPSEVRAYVMVDTYPAAVTTVAIP